ncbi:hypothetical protein WI40_19965 [Burkholderia ubonensis]|uniref:hypothetical protein n=1 Tax=Burkholderia ubonensis TaxID=101571 RepID=UPI000758755D|nr:hypothetical protein [Burkholderia ubonensis]KUZ93959.1 hypothetical protein WI40_19965 [Burkholderia ubonensis]
MSRGGLPHILKSAQPGLPEALAVHAARAVLAEVNLELVRLIGSHGVKALGVTGQDSGLMVAAAESDAALMSTVTQFDEAAFGALRDNGRAIGWSIGTALTLPSAIMLCNPK